MSPSTPRFPCIHRSEGGLPARNGLAGPAWACVGGGGGGCHPGVRWQYFVVVVCLLLLLSSLRSPPGWVAGRGCRKLGGWVGWQLGAWGVPIDRARQAASIRHLERGRHSNPGKFMSRWTVCRAPHMGLARVILVLWALSFRSSDPPPPPSLLSANAGR